MTAIKLKTEETDAKTICSQVTASFNAVGLANSETNVS